MNGQLFQGCDGSLLLDDDLPAIQSEKHVPANDKSACGFEVVDDIKGLFGCSPGLGSAGQACTSDPRRSKSNAWE